MNGVRLDIGDIVQIYDGSYAIDSNGVSVNGLGAVCHTRGSIQSMPEKTIVVGLGNDYPTENSINVILKIPIKQNNLKVYDKINDRFVYSHTRFCVIIKKNLRKERIFKLKKIEKLCNI